MGDMTEAEIEKGLNESIAAGHVKRHRPKGGGEPTYSMTRKGLRYVERELMPLVLVPASALNALCKRADEEAWRRDRLTKEIGALILRIALGSAP